MDQQVIERYAQGAQKLIESIRGLTVEDLCCAPPADKNIGRWSIQEVVIHLADAEAAFADRIKRIIAEDQPVLLAWDENRFSQRLQYMKQSAADAVKIVELTRRQLAAVLRELGPADFERAGTHSQRGRQTLGDVIQTADKHLEHHLKFIAAKREYFGKAMW